MDVNDRCAVGKCNNARKFPEKFVIKPHIFAFDTSLQLRSPAKRTASLGGGKKSKILYSSPSKEVNDSTIIDFELSSVDIDVDAVSTPHYQSLAGSLLSTSASTAAEHDMCMLTVASSSTYSISEVIPANPISLLQQPKLVRLHWHFVKEKKRIVKLYTGCPSPEISEFIVDHVRAKHQKIHYYKGSNSMNVGPKQYQLSPVKDLSQHKPGPSRILSLEDEILMNLMRIRLDCPVEDLAFRFGVSVSLAASIIATFIVFLSLELKPLIDWPTPDERISYKHFHFNGTFDECEGIGDCTEQWIEHSKNPDAQYQTYSSYKSNNTLKTLIFCTKYGSISYISGAGTDRFITEDTNISAKFTPGFMVLFDKGFFFL